VDNNIKLKNKKLRKTVRCIINNDYINVYRNNINNLKKLRNKVKKSLVADKGVIINKITGYKAKITNVTINKILYPAPKFDVYDIRYINNLNAAVSLKTLFERAVYIDTLKPMKNKTRNMNEIGYHHFVSPIIMNGMFYRVLLTTREKVNSNILYIVSAEIYDESYIIKKQINVEDLVREIKIWNYELEKYLIYNFDDIVSERSLLYLNNFV